MIKQFKVGSFYRHKNFKDVDMFVLGDKSNIVNLTEDALGVVYVQQKNHDFMISNLDLIDVPKDLENWTDVT